MSLIDEIILRRIFFSQNFPMIKIARHRFDVNSNEILKNTCPVCGYLTLNERDSFDICIICFWEDDGIDDYEKDFESGPNHMTLTEARNNFIKSKNYLLRLNLDKESIGSKIKSKFIELDNLIVLKEFNENEILKVQDELIYLFEENNICGIDKLLKQK